MRAVNLLPKDVEQVAKRGLNLPVVAGAAAVLAVALLAIGWVSASSNVRDQQDALDAARADLASIPVAAQPATGSLSTERQARVAALSSALTSRIAWDRILREVSLVLPDDVWLTQLTGQAPGDASALATPTPAPTQTGQGLHLTGYTYSQASVARLLARLQVIPDLEQVALNSSSTTTIGKRTVVQFDIGADVKPATTPAAPVSPKVAA